MEWKKPFTLTIRHPLWVLGLSQLQSDIVWSFFIFYYTPNFNLIAIPLGVI